ncbi:MAG: hypothetical protein KJZ93_04705 [Caldilineaceae bacterium]|nr:hypothetical protein [Caldilineaceae bacterium]
MSVTAPKRLFIVIVVASVLGWIWIMAPSAAHAQNCDPTVEAFYNATTNVCRQIGLGEACYGSAAVSAAPAGLNFNAQGRRVEIAKFTNINTEVSTGSVLMFARSNTGPVKIIAFGNTGVNPQGSSGQLFTLRPGAKGLTCDSTRSGMLLQTSQQPGSLTVNGVQIDLASTAFVSVEGGALYDQNPRDQRRAGQRNPNAPLCSGFDSDCDFGDRQCPAGHRIVWGPFCQAASYPYIQNGLYRVTLLGVGNVVAGATEYGSHGQDHFAFGRYDVTLPATYTFCWPGQGAGGQGFETIVQSKGTPARIDHITLEYLGPNCAAPSGSPPSDQFAVMSVSNVEGRVAVSAAGVRRDLQPGEQARILLRDLRPVTVSGPMPARDVTNSRVIQWLTWDPAGLPAVNREPARPPVVRITQTDVPVTTREYQPGLIFQAVAYDPAVGRSDGAGIARVNFRVIDPQGRVVVEEDEGAAPFCAFGDDDGECNVWYYFAENQAWPNGERIRCGTTYTLWAQAVSARGLTAEASTTIRSFACVVL